MTDLFGGVCMQVALHSFTGEAEEELSFAAGDELVVFQHPEGGWWEGELRGVTGWFPAAFVDPIGRAAVRPRSQASLADRTSMKVKVTRAFESGPAESSDNDDDDNIEVDEKKLDRSASDGAKSLGVFVCSLGKKIMNEMFFNFGKYRWPSKRFPRALRTRFPLRLAST
jgi:hypothetical protein